jgi:hypothetical protein
MIIMGVFKILVPVFFLSLRIVPMFIHGFSIEFWWFSKKKMLITALERSSLLLEEI